MAHFGSVMEESPEEHKRQQSSLATKAGSKAQKSILYQW